MKIERIDENTIIVFLNKLKIKEELLSSSSYLETYFRSIFKLLKDKYQININGYYHITLYQDSIYGVIMNMKKEFTDYFDYFDNQVDMKIDIERAPSIIYELDDYSMINKEVWPFISIYKYRDKIYVKPIKTINQLNLGYIIENSTIIYGEKCKQVLKFGKLIKSKYIFI